MNLERDVEGGGAWAFDAREEREVGIFGGPIDEELAGAASRLGSTVKTKPESSATSLKAARREGEVSGQTCYHDTSRAYTHSFLVSWYCSTKMQQAHWWR